MPKIVKVAVELEDKEAQALAQFTKRVQWEQIRQCAVDDAEAYVVHRIQEVREAAA
jgi:hypothetical protein